MPTADTPIRPLAPHAHGQSHGHAHEASAPARTTQTLLGSGLSCRLSAATALVALLWVVVVWALA